MLERLVKIGIGAGVLAVSLLSCGCHDELKLTGPSYEKPCELQVSKKVDKKYATVGTELNYEIRLTNVGNGVCGEHSLKLTDPISSGLYFKSIEGSRLCHFANSFTEMTRRPILTWDCKPLEPGRSTTVSWSGIIKNYGGNYALAVVNKAFVWADGDNYESNEVMTVVTRPKI